jgi:hypothetical protein
MSRKSSEKSRVMEKTTISLFDQSSTSETRRTYVIFGVGRGGTTMVAGVAKFCGLDIGEDLPINLEDNDFNLAVLKKKGITQPVMHIIDVMAQRNQSKNVWGWKFPRAIVYLPQIREHLVNPHLILVSRDPMATATREILSGTPKMDAIELVLRLQLRNMDLVKQWQVPTLIVSYERSVQHPEQFITDMCGFLHVERPVDTANIRAFMQPGEYKSI